MRKFEQHVKISKTDKVLDIRGEILKNLAYPTHLQW